ncbi:GNAT superfamily N-acetyltransferase [Rhodobium orientis]|uniref:GNAT family N-acetyltransferase n=1 Tax=Rhodobium orientis TaxID=34017 RepID=A0A327JK09_9HYPH|nr:GNAT family N-acetyltransferase [Rhodobium orientis]MBB4302043.1 GNAT superfamily N-acetyltransferase [Rhodobium orientis]MBK5950280.1 GNAT family N-acetyltransferase [Rhodobium orientis]RAI25976.1 GNAT family N-acetyltransferase [Rhodobium orientis]
MPSTAFHLRLAIPEDVPAIEAIVEAAYAPYVPRMGKKPGPMLDDYAARVAEGVVQVATRDGTVEGVLVLLPGEDHLLLDNVAVAPSAQGSGLGRFLVAAAERAAADRGHKTLRLYTHETMTENIAMYLRLGYAETHRVTEKGFERVYLEKRVK